MTSEFQKFLKERVTKLTNEMAAIHTRQPGKLPDVDTVTFINQERTRGTLSSGQEVDTIPVGTPEETDIGYNNGNDVYIVQNDPLRLQYTDGGSTQCFAIAASSQGVRADLYALSTGASCTIPIPADLVAKATPGFDNWSVGFTPSGKHIVFTIIENIVDSTLKTTTGVTAHWLYYKGFTLSKNASGGGEFTSTQVQGSANLNGLIVSPNDPSITWSNNQVLSSLTGGGSSYFTLQDDPNFPENSEIAYTIDHFPESDNDYNSGNEAHNIVSVFYEEVDIDGVKQPAVDFVGSVLAYKRLTKVKRVVEIRGVGADTHEMTTTSAYANTSSSRAFYMDVDRVANVDVTLTSTCPYANTPPSAATTPGLITGKYSSGSSSTIYSNIWGTGKQYYLDGPDCDDVHQHTYLDPMNSGVFGVDSYFVDALGTYVESLGLTVGTPVSQSITFDFKTINSPANCTTGTMTTTVGINISQSIYKESTNQIATVFYYSANSGDFGVLHDPDSNVDGYDRESIITAFKSTSGSGSAAFITPSSSNPSTAAFLVVQDGYLDLEGTDVDNIVFFGTLAYNDLEVLDLLTYSEFDTQIAFKVIDSSAHTSLTMLSIESLEAGTKWRIRKWRYTGGFWSQVKMRTVNKPNISQFSSQPSDYIMRN